MSLCCLKCRKNTENINLRYSKTSNGKTMILSKCAIYGNKKPRSSKNPKYDGYQRSLATMVYKLFD